MRRPFRKGDGVARIVSALLFFSMVLGFAALASAQDVYVDVVINGRRLYNQGLVYGDRTYVELQDVARILGGRYVYDPDLNVAFVNTGRYFSLIDRELVRLNPKLDQYYQPMTPLVPGMGVHHGAPGPHLTVVQTPAGVVTAFLLILPAESTESLPWFDQGGGDPIDFPGVGKAYTQHLYVVRPGLVQPGGKTEIAFNGLPLGISDDAVLWRGDRLYVRLRDLAVASGGGVGWDRQNRVASAKIVPGDDLTYDKLVFLNPELDRYYKRLSEFVPGMGYHYGVEGQGIVVGLDGEGFVALFELIFPEGTVPWMAWFDQEMGHLETIPGIGPAYSQHIYLVPPESIEAEDGHTHDR